MASHAATVAATAAAQSLPKFRYLSAWFCPFAHRATLALEYHRGRVEYEWVEALGWKKQDDHDNVTGTGQEWYYHWKADELRRVNPSALVPTLIPLDMANGGRPLEDRVVYESVVTIDYVDAVATQQQQQQAQQQQSSPPVTPLVPTDPYEAARCRIWVDKVNRECCSPYYGVLVRTDETERRQHWDQLVQGLHNFDQELSRTPNGPLFRADGHVSNVDLTLLPWAYRYYVLEHYRGPEYAVPPELSAYHAWYNHMISLDFVQRTLPDSQRYLDHIAKYADGSARSKVANAVRRGVAAHDFDDDKDDYDPEAATRTAGASATN